MFADAAIEYDRQLTAEEMLVDTQLHELRDRSVLRGNEYIHEHIRTRTHIRANVQMDTAI